MSSPLEIRLARRSQSSWSMNGLLLSSERAELSRMVAVTAGKPFCFAKPEHHTQTSNMHIQIRHVGQYMAYGGGIAFRLGLRIRRFRMRLSRQEASRQ